MRRLHSTPRYASLFILALLLFSVLMLGGCLAEDDRDKFVLQTGDGTGLSFATDVNPILTDAGCAGCHGFSGSSNPCAVCHSSGSPPPIDAAPGSIIALSHSSMVARTSTVVTGNLIVTAGSSDTSVFWWLVNGDSRYTGAMSTLMGLSGISSAKKAIIRQWIDDGAGP